MYAAQHKKYKEKGPKYVDFLSGECVLASHLLDPLNPFRYIRSNTVNSVRIALQTYKRFATLENKVMYVFCVSPLMIWALNFKLKTLLFHQLFLHSKRLY